MSFILCVCSVAQSRLIPCNCMDCSPPGSSVHGILYISILLTSFPYSSCQSHTHFWYNSDIRFSVRFSSLSFFLIILQKWISSISWLWLALLAYLSRFQHRVITYLLLALGFFSLGSFWSFSVFQVTHTLLLRNWAVQNNLNFIGLVWKERVGGLCGTFS